MVLVTDTLEWGIVLEIVCDQCEEAGESYQNLTSRDQVSEKIEEARARGWHISGYGSAVCSDCIAEITGAAES